MNTDFTICVGTVGAGVWFSPDGGEHWRRSRMNLPFDAEPGEIQIRSLAVSPHNPHHVLAGSEVKSLRDGHVSLGEAYATVRDNEVWLVGAAGSW